MRLSIYILITFIFFSINVKAQFSETISSDRPGQSFTATTLGRKVVQVQTGFNFSNEDSDSTPKKSQLSTTFFRLGITETFDFEALVNWRSIRGDVGAKDSLFAQGLSNVQLGFKYQLLENNGWVPSLAFQGRLITKLVGKDYERKNVGMVYNMASYHQLKSWLSVTMNYGLVLPGESSGTDDLGIEGYYVPATLNFAFAVTDKVGAFVEMYGNLNYFRPGFDAGFSYLVTNNLMFDIYGGFNNTKVIDTWFVEGGLSYRLNWRKE
ncbi:transporter [Flammeovirga kamogawensis]|uniref:Transporter n=1 Tax=Flammeovirga kamogawensis TaxID=373891 RepID=A0ABX8H094_9BACT|nr:transporter [Flammeovirga kamogawensis]MBB6459271.1 hypothetical protein [Flammeovirga kamogawensis]QWG08832.1 transporter [Flammeovirga kamogawensis]TRX67122.1 transporter [Flammeovirga kamogawensis]